MKISVARDIGFCFGVERAYKMSLATLLEKREGCQMLGNLVHNERVIEELKEKGIKPIYSVGEAKKGTVVIRAHGIGDDDRRELKKRGARIVDTTCPLVRKAQDYARILDREGRKVVIIGEKNHAEIKAINGAIGERGILIENESGISDIPKGYPVGVVVQTTQNAEKIKGLLSRLKKEIGDIKIFETFCDSVMKRQADVRVLAEKNDLILVVGSESSANTRQLAKIASEKGKKTYRVNGRDGIKKEWFSKNIKVGVISGTSVPEWLINEVVEKLNEIKKEL